MRSAPHELIGIGLYSIGDAARLLKTPARTIRRWMGGYARFSPTVLASPQIKVAFCTACPAAPLPRFLI